MPTRLPPRREPRVLAVRPTKDALLWAVVDPWEVRGAGQLHVRAQSVPAAVERLARREKPTAIVAYDAELSERLRQVPTLPVVGLPAKLPSVPVALDLYPELKLYAPSRGLKEIACLALAVVFRGAVPTRTYAPRRR